MNHCNGTQAVNVCLHEALYYLQVETIQGLRELQIPPGIQPGETIKLPYMGVPNIENPSVRGDHHFVVSIEIPKTLRFSP